jgi:2,3-bisphosphoglycerate-independent phosphoglycerate mutase
MSALEMTELLKKRIQGMPYDFILLNFANADMVGHTGDIQAAIKAVKTIDYCTKELVNLFTSLGGAVIVTADHGNAEEMLNEDNSMNTEHSINPVPFILAGTDVTPRVLPYGALCDVAPTILQLMGIQQPAEMTGKSLIKRY